MKKYQDLHDLIHSMDKAEKRYFKMQANLHTKKGVNNYIRLFELIERQPEPDDKQLEKKLAGSKLGKNLSSSKYQLYNYLLRTLRTLHDKNAVEGRLRASIGTIEVLSNKGLWSAATSALKKAQKDAEKFGLHLYQLILADWDRRLQEKMHSASSWSPEGIHAMESRAMKAYRRDRDFHHLRERIERLTKGNKDTRSVDVQQQLDDIYNHELIQEPEVPEAFWEGWNYLKVRSRYVVSRSDDVYSAYEHHQRIRELWKANPQQIELRPDRYLDDMLSLLAYCAKTERVDEMQELLTQIRQVKIKARFHAARTNERLYQYELFVAINYRGFAEGNELITQVAAWLAKNESYVTSRAELYFYYQFAVFYFLYTDFGQSNQWVNKILNHPDVSERPDLRDFCRIMQIILQFELGNYELVEYFLRSTYRYLRRQGSLIEFERLFLEYIGKSTRKASKQEFRKSFKDLRLKLEAEWENPTGKKPLGLYEVIFWLESQERGIPLSELIKEKLETRPKSQEKTAS